MTDMKDLYTGPDNVELIHPSIFVPLSVQIESTCLLSDASVPFG